MSKALSMLVALILLSALAGPASAQRQRVRVGTLVCNLAPGMGLVVGSRQNMRCRFGGQIYQGSITRLGLDVGVTAGGRLVWAVYALTRGLPRRALAGTYVGASGDIALGLGLGANVLVGGSNRSVALQPLSVEAQAGVNLALGVAGLSLR